MRLQSISVEDLVEPAAIGPDTVGAVSKALLLARGGPGDDPDAVADERMAQLDAELDRIHSTLDGLDEQLSAIDRSFLASSTSRSRRLLDLGEHGRAA